MKYNIDGYQYEYQCADLLKKSGFSKVRVTKASSDQGIDILACRNGETYGIQCKYYSSSVGNKAVQEAYAGAKYYNCDIAVVMTNSTFTKSARELAEKTNVCLWEHSATPYSYSRFRITNWIGIYMISSGVLTLLTLSENPELPLLQRAYIGSFMIGGLCNLLEFQIWILEASAFLFYALAFLLSTITGYFSDGSFHFDGITFVALVFTFFRARTLCRLTHKSRNSN